MSIELDLAEVRTVDPPSDDVLRRAFEELRAAMRESSTQVPAGSALHRTKRAARTRSSNRRRGLIVAVVGVTFALVAAFTVFNQSGGASPAAAAELRHLSDVAERQPAALAPQPGQYLLTESIQANEDCPNRDAKDFYCFLLPEHRSIWIAADGSGRILETYGVPTFYTTLDHRHWIEAGRPSNPPSNTIFGKGGLSFANLSALLPILRSSRHSSPAASSRGFQARPWTSSSRLATCCGRPMRHQHCGLRHSSRSDAVGGHARPSRGGCDRSPWCWARDSRQRDRL